VEVLRHGGAGYCSDNDREEGSQLDDAVAPRQALGGQQLRQQAVLRGPKKCSLGRNQPERDQANRLRMGRQSSGCHGHGSDFHPLGPERDSPLAEAIRKPAPRHAEEHEGHGEKKCDQGDKAGALITRQPHADNHRQQQVSQDVVAVGTLKLGNDQCPKAALAALLRKRYR